MRALGCPFCGADPLVEPERPEIDGNAWGAVRCVNKRCPTYDRRFGRGVEVQDGALTSDERGSAAYKRAAIRRWNRRSDPTHGRRE